MNSMALYAVLLVLLALVQAIILVRDWKRTRDVLFPTMYFLPMMFVLYVIFPLGLWAESEDLFIYFGGGAAQLCWYTLQVLAITIALAFGARYGAGSARGEVLPAEKGSNAMLYTLGASLALLGCIVFYGAIFDAGGFAAVYGTSYSSVYIENGWVSELRIVGLAAVPLIMLARRRAGMRLFDWCLVAVAVSPLLLQGLLGARRGPTFLAVSIVVVGYLAIFKPKVRPLYFMGGGALLGFFLLFLVSNRETIYVGSGEVGTRSVGSALVDFRGNEYMYGLAFMRYIDSGAAPYYGRRVLGHMLGRIAPKSIWPDAYLEIAEAFDMPDVDYRLNAGAPLLRMESALGYLSPNGAAPGIVGEFYLEFGAYLSILAAFLIAAFYGYLWRKSVDSAEFRFTSVYLLLVALGIYLVTQSLEAWLYRGLLIGVPLWLLTALFDRAAAKRARRMARPSAQPPVLRRSN